MYDIIIIGAGPAGLSAAIYSARKKLSTLVLTGETSGQIVSAHLIENYLGIPEVSGVELTEKFLAHVKKFDIQIKEGVEVEKIEAADGGFEVVSRQGKFAGRALIIATGKRYRELDVPGAKEYEGKGISYCATCDAPIFKNKIVAVIGAGDAGQDTAWQLTKYASKVYLLNKYPELRGHNITMQENLKNNEKIEIYNNYEPLEVKGDKFVKTLVFKHNGHGKIKEIAVDGIFVQIGSIAASDLLKDMIKLNEKSEVVIDPKTNMSSYPGIFAAGDVSDIIHKQLIIAAGEGAKAALSAYEYLMNN